MDDNFLVVDKHISKRGEEITEFREVDGKILIKHFTGVNTDNYILKKYVTNNEDTYVMKIEFSFFQINGIYYININGNHIIDYKKFSKGIQQISNVKSLSDELSCNVIIRNCYFGEIILQNCDTELVYKMLNVMKDWIKGKNSFFKNLLYYIVF